jgi:UDP-N-acetylmuramate dehydrogenase
MLGVGSNVIVRDGGVEGVVIRWPAGPLARSPPTATRSPPGAGALDAMVARAAANAGLAGLEFYAGIPGTIGGALTMNAGCYGSRDQGHSGLGLGYDAAGERVWDYRSG